MGHVWNAEIPKSRESRNIVTSVPPFSPVIGVPVVLKISEPPLKFTDGSPFILAARVAVPVRT
jgi:hypothetical protein